MNVTEHIQKAFNDEFEKARRRAGAEDPIDIVNDPNILAHTELGKTVCM